MLEVGKRYYIIAHAYYHYVGEVVMVNPREVTMKNCVQVHSCSRSWTEFFAGGFKNDTQYDLVPDGTIIPLGLPCYPWLHDIPAEKKGRK